MVETQRVGKTPRRAFHTTFDEDEGTKTRSLHELLYVLDNPAPRLCVVRQELFILSIIRSVLDFDSHSDIACVSRGERRAPDSLFLILF